VTHANEKERFRRVRLVFHDALSVAPGERERFLAEVCAEDAALLREVTNLLEYQNRFWWWQKKCSRVRAFRCRTLNSNWPGSTCWKDPIPFPGARAPRFMPHSTSSRPSSQAKSGPCSSAGQRHIGADRPASVVFEIS
jgi:hypothetical protein